jgi:ketosteroid isomerase-like protein
MKRPLLTLRSLKGILLLAALLILPAAASAQVNAKYTDQKSTAAQAVRQTLDELYAALGRNDAAALDRIYADDYALINESGERTAKAPRLAAIKSGEMKYESLSFADPAIQVHGDTAVATYRATVKAVSNGKEVAGQMYVTTVFVKMKGQWRLVAAQATRIGS